MERRLAAVVVADVVGFSRMVAADDTGTIERMRELRDTITEPAIKGAGGRIVKRTGDGTLVEFSSVLGAVNGAIDVQRKLADIANNDPEDRRFILRIGVHLGEVLVETGGDIHGDGVNVAARLEALCAPGEILVSGEVWEHLNGRLDVPAEELGPRELKNIPGKVSLHRLIPVEGATPAPGEADPGKASQPLSEKPSIVVLPFDNLSRDPEQEFFSDGIVEDITTALSHFGGLFVIARNTAFTYRGQAINVRDVGRELGVQYVMEGSVRKAGDRIRVAAQLIDATADRHIWAQKYDGRIEDGFELQDEITRNIVGSVAPEIEADAIAKAIEKKARDLSDHERLQRAKWHLTLLSAEHNLQAEEICKDLLQRNPDLAEAYTTQAWGYGYDALYAWNRPTPDSLKLAMEASQNAIARDPLDAAAHSVLGALLFSMRRHEDAEGALKRAIEINPNLSIAYGFLGMVQSYTHDFENCFESLQEAIRLSPRDPQRAMFIANIGQAKFNARDYEGALGHCLEAVRENPRLPSAVRALTAAYGMIGDLEKAAEAYSQLDKLVPGISLSTTRGAVGFAFADDESRFLEGLRRAGMPE